jgi:hypothetical protein
MKIIHRSKYRGPHGQVSTLQQLQITVQDGTDWKHEFAGEDRVAALLARQLDDTFTLIRNLPVPGEEDDFDMVLVGPAGIWEFEILNFVGLVRGEVGWMYWDYGQQSLQPIVLRDLGPRIQTKAAQLEQLLSVQGLTVGEVVQAVILSTPNAPRDFAIPGLSLVFPEELASFVQSAIHVLHPNANFPVVDIVRRLAQVDGGADDEYVGRRIWGMTPRQVMLVAVLLGLNVFILATLGFLWLLFNLL